MTEPTPNTPESELTTGDPARDFVYWFVEQPHHRQQAFVIDWLARHPEVVRDTRWPFAALPNRERLARALYEEAVSVYRRERKPSWDAMVADPSGAHDPRHPARASNGTMLASYREQASRVLDRLGR